MKVKMKVKIASQVFHKVKIAPTKEISVRELLRRNLHKLLDRWIDKSVFHELGDNILFEIVKDDDIVFEVVLKR